MCGMAKTYTLPSSLMRDRYIGKSKCYGYATTLNSSNEYFFPQFTKIFTECTPNRKLCQNEMPLLISHKRHRFLSVVLFSTFFFDFFLQF